MLTRGMCLESRNKPPRRGLGGIRTGEGTSSFDRVASFSVRRFRGLDGKLPPLKAILRGSLIERYKRCGKPGCKCADGPGHGPKYYLSVSYPGLRPQMDYVPQESYPQTTALLANYHRAREIAEEERVEADRELNRVLVHLGFDGWRDA